MYRIVPSETARNAVASLDDSRRAELAEITLQLESFFTAFVRAGLVTSTTWFGRDLYRYYDRQFPYMLILSFPAGEDNGAELHLHMLLAAAMRR